MNFDISDSNWLENYQKEAIYRALQEYKREAERVLQWSKQLESKQENYDKHLSLVNRYWEQLLIDLKMLIDRVDDSTQLRDSNFLKRLTQIDNEDQSIEKIENAIIEKCTITKEIVKQLLEKIILWIEKRNNLIKDLQGEINDPTLRENRSIQLLQSENQDLNQINSLKDELQMTKNQLGEKIERLESTEEQLRQAEKRMDKSKSVTLGYWSGVKTQTLQESQSNDNNSKQLEEKLFQFQSLSESRLKEVEEISKEKANLKIEINNLHSRVIESSLYKNLQLQYLHCKENLDYLRTFMEQNSREMEKMIATRNSATNQIQEENKLSKKDAEEQLNKLLTDLDRIRAQRDDVTMEVDKLRAMLPTDFHQINALRVIANDRKTIIKQLMDEVRRLHMKLAAQEGNKDAADFYCNPVQPPEFSYDEIASGADTFEFIQQKLSYDHHLQERLNYGILYFTCLQFNLKKKNRQSEEIRAKLEQQLDNYMNNAHPGMQEYQRMKISELEYKREVDELKSQIEEYDKRYGIKDPSGDPIHVLTKKIEELMKKISKLETECDYLKKNEKELLQELQVLGDHWTRQDEENTRKVFEIIAQDERLQIARESESKARQKLNAIWMENVSLKKQKNHLSTVIQSQTDHVRQMKYLEDNLKSQLENANKEIACSKQVVDVHKLKLIEMTQQQKEMKEKIDKAYNSYIDLQKRYDDLTKSYEKETFKVRRLNEELEICKKKVEEVDNDKSNVTAEKLVYSYECLGQQQEARNRKCATCGLAFSTSDIKQIFLC
ncbi:10648_t:CDS:10 [Entrophospora sp. SA101]|nr:10648_t:CDS:10 [Entrophospora sp. SA101]CAJ0905297.1 5526_t:CDS:10 [Entrophospora sp. SA101]